MKLLLELLIAGDESPKQRPWFCLLPSYWFPSKQKLSSSTYNRDEEDDADSDKADIEPISAELRDRIAVSTRRFRRVFPGGYGKPDAVAVNGFTYDMYEGEILAILGHNGAGKTTLINMLTGLLAPTSGQALIYGNDVTKVDQLDAARTMIGICPQHDVLFDTLTVREHIEFYARLKGFSTSSARLAE